MRSLHIAYRDCFVNLARNSLFINGHGCLSSYGREGTVLLSRNDARKSCRELTANNKKRTL